MPQNKSKIQHPAFSQPHCTALQIALVDLLASWNIEPAAVLGHSSGEIAAAYCAGAISQESAWKLAYYRGTVASYLSQSSNPKRGSMMAVALSQEAIIPYLAQITGTDELTVGCINSPTNITVTGAEQAIDALKELLDLANIFARKLSVGVAYHSTQMEEVASEYSRLVGEISRPYPYENRKHAPLMYSSVTGQIASPDQLRKGAYWVANLCSKVHFAEALLQMCSATSEKDGSQNLISAMDVNHLVEIGPHSALRRPVKETLAQCGYSSALQMGVSATESMLQLVGKLCRLGVVADLLAANNLSKSSGARTLVKLPAYPFNHSQVYWHESRLSKNFRFREHPRHELLGSATADWNPLEAKWRNIIKPSENPWTKDHKFNGSEIYPAAGIIAMAIEAVRQVRKSVIGRRIKGYRCKEVTFAKAVVLTMNAEGVETEFYLRPHNGQVTLSSERSDFRLCMLSNNEWVESCRGTIFVEYDEDEIEVDHNLEAKQAQKRYKGAYARGSKHCTSRVDSKQMYENLNALGFNFGPAFQSLGDVWYSDNGEAMATVQIHAWKSKVPTDEREIQQHVIHSTALDGVFHLTVTAITRGGWSPIPTMVPTHLQNLRISNDFLTQPDLESIKVYSTSKSKGYREADFDILALNAKTDEPVITLDGYRATAVTSLNISSSGGSHWRRLCYSIAWKPDLDLLDRKQLAVHCNDSVDRTQLYAGEMIDIAEIVCLYFMSEALKEISSTDCKGLEPHLEKYLDWMRYQCDRYDAKSVLSSLEGMKFMGDASYRDVVLSKLENSGPEGKVYITIGTNLVHILRGEVDPLELLFSGQLLQSFYSGSSFVANYQKISAFVDLCSHKNPNHSILEIGAGTGGATALILETLEPEDPNDKNRTPRYDQYTYTDISAGFF